MLQRSWQWSAKSHFFQSFWTPCMIVNTNLSSQHLVSRHLSNLSNFVVNFECFDASLEGHLNSALLFFLRYNLRICGNHPQWTIGTSKWRWMITSYLFGPTVNSIVSFWNLLQLVWRNRLSWTAICIPTSDITWGRSELLCTPNFWNLTKVWQLKPWPKLLEWQWTSLICK